MFKNLYNSKILSVYSNLDTNSYIKNNQLIDNIKNGDIEPEKLVH